MASRYRFLNKSFLGSLGSNGSNGAITNAPNVFLWHQSNRKMLVQSIAKPLSILDVQLRASQVYVQPQNIASPGSKDGTATN